MFTVNDNNWAISECCFEIFIYVKSKVLQQKKYLDNVLSHTLDIYCKVSILYPELGLIRVKTNIRKIDGIGFN